MHLYEISGQYLELLEGLETVNAEIDYLLSLSELNEEQTEKLRDLSEQQQAYKDTLEAVDGDFVSKAEAIACYIKDLTSEAEAIKAEIKKLQSRKRVKENLIEYLKKNILLENLLETGKHKIETARVKLSLRNNAESAKIDNDILFIKWAEENSRDDLLTYKAPDISKTNVKKALQSGEKIPGASLIRTQSVVIK